MLLRTRNAVLPKPDMSALSGIKLMPGKAIVEMAAVEKEHHGLILPDKTSQRLKCAVGVVLACGPHRQGNVLHREVLDFDAGDAVFVHPQHGKRVEGWYWGDYDATNQVRLFGVMASYLGRPVQVPLSESILGAMNGERIRAVGTNVLLRLTSKTDKIGELYVPDWLNDREDCAEVVSVGAGVEGVEPGEEWVYERRALKEIGEFDFNDGECYAFIDKEGLYYRQAS